jgi:hydrogenase maturation protein HypF
LIRRARGYAPLTISPILPLILPSILPVNQQAEKSDIHPAAGHAVLALGGQSKAGWCLVKDGYAHMGEYLGDLDDEAAWLGWNRSITHAVALLGGKPGLIACDAHPRYRTWAFPLLADFPADRIVTVQHHHAHIASVMAEHNLEGPVLGVSFDGTGYGLDGSVWGGEFLVCTGGGFTRAGALKPIPMLGGDASVEEGWKSLLCHLHASGLCMPPGKADTGRDALVTAALRHGVNTIASSSMGRLFDAVSALLGFSQVSRYEGECAILLEAAAVHAGISGIFQHEQDIFQYAENTVGPQARIPEFTDSIPHDGGSPFLAFGHDGGSPFLAFGHDGGIPFLAFGFDETRDGMPILDPAPIFSELLAGLRRGIDPGLLSRAFHYAVACATMKMLSCLAPAHNTKDVALSGGVFQNRLLLDLLLPLLEAGGFRVFLHRRVPPNDGGLALGQAFVACRKG